jgi:hypothetical protein
VELLRVRKEISTNIQHLVEQRLQHPQHSLDICDRALPASFDYHTGGILDMAAGSLAPLNAHYSGGPPQELGQGGLRNLQALRLTHARLSAAKLAALLDSCGPPGLKSFTYEATYPNWNTCYSECLPFRELKESMSFFVGRTADSA